MALTAIAIGILFISPAYYRLRACGYPAKAITGAVVLACALLLLASVHVRHADMAALLLAALFFLVASLVKARPSAPGPAYLVISFPCPKCGRTLSVAREREGDPELCPGCGEMVQVPGAPGVDEGGTREAPVGAGWEKDGEMVILHRYLSPERAEIAKQRLGAERIDAFLADETTAHSHRGIEWAGGGVRLMVRAEDAAAAEEVLNIPVAETALPDDFVPPVESQPELVRRDNFAPALLLSLFVLLILPAIFIQLWSLFVPVLFRGAVVSGRVDDHLSLELALRAAVISAGAVLLWKAVHRKWRAS